ncbi:MAG: ATP-binding cassette domain-containing protein [Actinomycetota bacterium]|nr:ATP-binding cassette domain-containing protein [Actinomycetota bacterium]
MLLSADNLRFTLPGADGAAAVDVLDGVDFAVGAGELVDVVGPSGCGKTTLLRALARLLPGATGALALDGLDAADVPAAEWRARVALAPQVSVMRAGTVRDNLVLPWRLRARAAIATPPDAHLRVALDGVGLSDISLERDAAKLSLGQAARVALLRVTLTAPDVLLLDEPDANLDDASAAQVRAICERFVRDGGAAVRVRHLRSDDFAARRYRLEGGHLSEVT